MSTNYLKQQKRYKTELTLAIAELKQEVSHHKKMMELASKRIKNTYGLLKGADRDIKAYSKKK